MAPQNTPSTASNSGAPNQVEAAFRALQTRIQQLEGRLQDGGIGQGTYKRKQPEPFDGKRTELAGFLTQVKAYFRHQNIQEPHEQVEFAGTLLKGEALAWFEPILADYIEPGEDGPDEHTSRIFRSFKNFERAINSVFGQIDEKRTTDIQIQRLKQQGSAHKYAAEFLQLSNRLDWNDEAFMSQFYQGLKEDVKDELSREDRPEELATYIERAVKIDNRLWERKMERKGNYPRPNNGNKFTPNHSRPKKHYQFNHNYYGPQKMELGATHRNDGSKPKDKKEVECFYCKKKGHFARECRKKQQDTLKSGVTTGNRTLNATRAKVHDSLHWSACYEDTCNTHESGKRDNDYYPGQNKRLCATRIRFPGNLEPVTEKETPPRVRTPYWDPIKDATTDVESEWEYQSWDGTQPPDYNTEYIPYPYEHDNDNEATGISTPESAHLDEMRAENCEAIMEDIEDAQREAMAHDFIEWEGNQIAIPTPSPEKEYDHEATIRHFLPPGPPPTRREGNSTIYSMRKPRFAPKYEETEVPDDLTIHKETGIAMGFLQNTNLVPRRTMHIPGRYVEDGSHLYPGLSYVYQQGDDIRLHMEHPEHMFLEWIYCIDDNCAHHFLNKKHNEWFPRRSEHVDKPQTAMEMQYWGVSAENPDDAYFEYQEYYGNEECDAAGFRHCLNFECEEHQEEKLMDWTDAKAQDLKARTNAALLWNIMRTGKGPA